MKNKKIWVILGLLIVTATAAYVLLKGKKTSSGTSISQDFTVTDTAKISKIILTPRIGSKHVLERTSAGWVLDGTIEIAPAPQRQLIETIYQLRVKRPCTRAEREVVIKAMATKNTKVEVFVEGEPAITYFLGDPTDENQGNYALLEDSEEPVVVNKPNWQGFPSAHYAVDPVNWRNKHLMRSNPRTLKQVSVTFPNNPVENLEVIVESGKGFRISTGERMDTIKVVEFLSAFGGIYVEEYLTDTRQRDSIAKQTPYAIVNLKDANIKNNVELYLYPQPFASLDDLRKQDHIVGYMPASKQAVMLQPQNVVPILRSKSLLTIR